MARRVFSMISFGAANLSGHHPALLPATPLGAQRNHTPPRGLGPASICARLAVARAGAAALRSLQRVRVWTKLIYLFTILPARTLSESFQGLALVASSLRPGQERRTTHESKVQIGNSRLS
jgi:hypothetical protein